MPPPSNSSICSSVSAFFSVFVKGHMFMHQFMAHYRRNRVMV
jgi:hypothetical protein